MTLRLTTAIAWVLGFISVGGFPPCAAGIGPGSRTPGRLNPLTVSAGPGITDVKTTSPRCGLATGVISLTASGGTGPLTYSIDGTSFQSQPLFGNLAGGNYTVYVRDAKGDQITTVVSLPISFSVGIAGISAQPATCGQADGSLTVTTTGGNGAMQYSLNGLAFQSGSAFSNLTGGTYTVQIRDGAGCSATQLVSMAGGPVIDTLKTTPPQCGMANGALRVLARGGVAPLTYALDESAYQSDASFTNLPGGTYTVRVRDAGGCDIRKTVALPLSPPLTLRNTTITPTTCGLPNGRITMAVSGGVGPIRFSIDGRKAQAGTLFDSLKAGTYTLFVQDSIGCTAGKSVNVAASSMPVIMDVAATPEACGQQNATLTVTTGDSATPYTFSIDGQTYQPDKAFLGLSGGDYSVSVRDRDGCVSTRPVHLPVDCAPVVYVPMAFSPNADNLNDVLTTYFSFPSLTVARFVVYDRWGGLVYSRVNFTLANGEPIWNGQSGNGYSAPPGIYPYLLHCQFPDGTQTTYRQSVTLVK